MTTILPIRAAIKGRNAGTVLVLAGAALVVAQMPLAAKPLDAETCGRLKSERDGLEAAGTRSALSEQPPSRPIRALDERSQRLAKLIQLDGVLRFRCGLDLPISSLKPELLVEVPDTIEGEAIVKPVPRKPAAKKARTPAATDQAKPADTELPVPRRTKSAASKAEKPAPVSPSPEAAEAPTAKAARPKAKAKVDDAYRPAPKAEGSDQP